MLLAAAAALLAAATAPQAPAAPPRPGLVVLLGSEADPADVPELAQPAQPAVRIELTAWDGSSSPPDADPVRLRPGDDRAAGDARLLARVRAAARIELGPAPAIDWLWTLHPRRKDGALLSALREAWRRGATVVARGETAGVVSRAGVVSKPADLRLREANPRVRELPRPAWGIGLQAWAVVELPERAGGSLARLVDVLARSGEDLGLALPPRAALVCDPAARAFTVRGAAAVLVDLRGARAQAGAVRGLRLDLLAPGATWSLRERAPAEPAPAPLPDSGRAERRELDADLPLAELLALLDHPAPPAELVLVGPDRSARLDLAGASSWQGSSQGSGRAALRIPCDLERARR